MSVFPQLDPINLNVVDVPKYMPNCVELRYSKIKNAGLGMFARESIKKNAFLGNYMGVVNHTCEVTNNMYEFTTVIHNKQAVINALDLETSNWTRFMNCALNPDDENVLCIRHITKDTSVYINNGRTINIDGYILFFANKDIEIGDELLYNYGEGYKRVLLQK